MVKLEWYRSFVGVYQAGTVTKAAKLLFLTQPAVSQHITSLEMTLGTKLFERMPRKMIPTENGKALYTRIISSINLLESTTNNYYQEKNKPKSVIRLGSPNEFFNNKILSHLTLQNNICRISFGNAQQLLEKLEKQQLDIVIATKTESTSKLIEYQELYIEKFVLVQSTNSSSTLKQFTNQNHSPPSESLLLQQNWISYATELPIIRRYWRELFQTRPAITPSIIIPDLNIIIEAVKMDKGISVLPSYICESEIALGNVEIIDSFNKNVSNTIYIAYRKADIKNPILLSFMNSLLNSI